MLISKLPKWCEYYERTCSANWRVEKLRAEFKQFHDTSKVQTVDEYLSIKVQEYDGMIEHYITEGKKKNGPQYSLPRIEYYAVNDPQPDGFRFCVQSSESLVDFDTVAMLEGYIYETVVSWHKASIILYENYDRNSERFAELIEQITTIGGEAMLLRPYFKARMPAPGLLRLESYTLACSDYNLGLLKSLLDEMDSEHMNIE